MAVLLAKGAGLVAFGLGVYFLVRWTTPDDSTRPPTARQLREMQETSRRLNEVMAPFVQEQERKNREAIRWYQEQTEQLRKANDLPSARKAVAQSLEAIKARSRKPGPTLSPIGTRVSNSKELDEAVEAYYSELRRVMQLSTNSLDPPADDQPPPS